jgi:hypothetical protein
MKNLNNVEIDKVKVFIFHLERDMYRIEFIKEIKSFLYEIPNYSFTNQNNIILHDAKEQCEEILKTVQYENSITIPNYFDHIETLITDLKNMIRIEEKNEY